MNESVEFDEETNALDYLERCIGFLREVESGNLRAWKWVAISLHGALYGFAVAAARGTDWTRVTYEKKDGTRRLLDLHKVLNLCQDEGHMKMLIHSQPLVLSESQREAIKGISMMLRNEFEHFVPKGWVIFVEGLPIRVFLVLKVVKFLALETSTYVHLDDSQSKAVAELVQEGYDICNRVRTSYKSG